jgi:hypothetical protein
VRNTLLGVGAFSHTQQRSAGQRGISMLLGLNLNAVRWYKALLLILAISVITAGSVYFLKAIW